MSESRGRLLVVSCEAGKEFLNKVLYELKEIAKKEGDTETNFTVDVEEIHFANGEIKTVFGESIRGSDLFIIQDIENSTLPYSVNDNFMAVKTAIDAGRLCGARRISAVLPVFPYARQDKRKEKEGITSAIVVRELEDCGIGEVLTMDLHNPAIGACFKKARPEILRASKNIIDYIRTRPDMKNICVVSPDAGGTVKAEYYANKLGTELVTTHKKRDYSKQNAVEKVHFAGDIEGKDVLIVDDMIDTGGTVAKVIQMLKEHGAGKIHFACSLPLLNGDAIELLDKLYEEGLLEDVIATDSVYHGGEEFAKKHPWFKEVSVAKYFARVIYNINHYKPISELIK